MQLGNVLTLKDRIKRSSEITMKQQIFKIIVASPLFLNVFLTLFKFGNKTEKKKYIGTGLQLARLFEGGQAT